MFEWSAEGGLAALFIAAFVSATVLPANSEIVMIAFLRAHPESLLSALGVATLGNTLGSLTTYGLGRLIPQRRQPPERALAWVRRYGVFALLLAWLPVVGDALCAAAGWLRVPLGRATLAIAAGKFTRYVAVAMLGLATLSVAQAAQGEKPATYALLSALGNRFEVIHVGQQTGSHLEAAKREAYMADANLINRLVLQGLDRAVKRLDPDSHRVYLSMDPGWDSRYRGPRQKLPDSVLRELRKMDRSSWDRLLVAVPAQRVEDKDGLGRRLQGMGLYVQPQCQSDMGFGNRMGSCENSFRPASGPEAHTPKGETMAANNFIAPYTFLEVWVMDPRTLEVIDRSTHYGHRKLADDSGNITGLIAGWHDDFLATQIVEVVQHAAREAVEDAGLRGKVQVHERGPVPAAK